MIDEPRPVGRPTDYREEYDALVPEWGKLGKSRAWIAAELGVAKTTLQRWEAASPTFRVAMALAKTYEQKWWEEEGQSALRASVFQASMWNRSMAARFPDDWREKVAHVGGGEGDGPIKQEIAIGADAFTRAIAGLATRAGEGEPPVSSDS